MVKRAGIGLGRGPALSLSGHDGTCHGGNSLAAQGTEMAMLGTEQGWLEGRHRPEVRHQGGSEEAAAP